MDAARWPQRPDAAGEFGAKRTTAAPPRGAPCAAGSGAALRDGFKADLLLSAASAAPQLSHLL
eukprot:2519218-Lingulodinium_polyedra.AAC.1